MTVRSRVVDVDKGWLAELRNSRRLAKQPHVTIGIHSKEGTFVPATSGEPVTVLQYAGWNEFGTRNIPERPFMRRTFDVNVEKYKRILGRLGAKILSGKMTVSRALEAVGTTAASDVQNTIARSKTWADANDPATVARKGSSTPLIDTGRMRQSIRHVVKLGAPIARRGV